MNVPAPQRKPAAVAQRAPEYATVAQLLDLYRKRAASPVEVVQDLFARVEKHESSLHCFVTQTPEVALARAREDGAPKMRDGGFLVPRLATHDDGERSA